MNLSQLLFLTLLLLMFLFRTMTYERSRVGSLDESISSQVLVTEIRDYLVRQINATLPQPQAGLLAGIILGAKEGLGSNLKKILTKTSTIHIAVVSGQNLSLLFGFVLRFVSVLGRKKTVVWGLLLCLIYCFITGFQIPVIRAFIMVFFASLATLFNRESNAVWILSLTGLLMLIINPSYLLSPSFQLSFAATSAVLVVAPLLSSYLNFLPNIIRSDTAVSLAVILLTLPITAWHFHQVSLIGVIVNTLVLWTISLIMLSGIAAAALSLVSLPLGIVAALAPGVLLTYFLFITSYFAQFEFSLLIVPNFNLVFWSGYYIVLIGLYVLLSKYREELTDSQESW